MQYFSLKIPLVNETFSLEGDEGHHLIKVKRCRIGENIKLFDGNGTQATAEVIQINKRDAFLKIIDRNILDKPKVKIVLLIVPPKGKNFSLILEKAVEIGVDEIVPVSSERSVKEYQAEKEVKYEKILLEAAKQCERAYLPMLHPSKTLQESFLPYEKPENLKLFFHTKDGGKYWEQSRHLPKGATCCLWIGPEGGWADSEIVFARSKDAYICTLPMPILRVETAVIAITSLLKTYLD